MPDANDLEVRGLVKSLRDLHRRTWRTPYKAIVDSVRCDVIIERLGALGTSAAIDTLTAIVGAEMCTRGPRGVPSWIRVPMKCQGHCLTTAIRSLGRSGNRDALRFLKKAYTCRAFELKTFFLGGSQGDEWMPSVEIDVEHHIYPLAPKAIAVSLAKEIMLRYYEIRGGVTRVVERPAREIDAERSRASSISTAIGLSIEQLEHDCGGVDEAEVAEWSILAEAAERAYRPSGVPMGTSVVSSPAGATIT